MIGRELDGRYRILARLGEGAMGEVYLVEHLGLGRKEALKTLRASMDDSPALVARFRREARATNRLQHPNIVAVYDFGRLPDGRFYLTTEYAEGKNLDKILREEGTLAPSRALAILDQLAGAIDHAHSRGVIHRDLKPANLILAVGRGQTEQLKVLDFGVAKIIAPDYAEAVATTGQGEVFGTPAYMAPEQIGARGSDPRIDIYAFGCLAFELLTGDPPFIGRPLQVLHDQLNTAPPRLLEREPTAPPELDALIARCLEKDPDARPQSGAELSAALAAAQGAMAALAALGTTQRRGSRIHAAAQAAAQPAEPTLPDPGNRWVTELGNMDEYRAIEETLSDEDLSLAPMAGVHRSDARLAVDAALVQLAEALLDQGCSDFQLTVTMANLAGARGSLDAASARMQELERSRDAVAARARESEKRFRFAIGELRFELEQARGRGGVAPESEYQLAQLEARMAELAAQAERELRAIDDRAISLAAECATHEEELAALISALEFLVEDVAPRFQSSPQIAELTERLRRVRRAAGQSLTGA